MSRSRFYDFRVRVQAYAESVGSPLGVCINDVPALAGLVNTVTERWIFDPLAPDDGWFGTYIRMLFNVAAVPGTPYAYITLPYGIARAMLLDVCTRPRKIQNAFYEFLDYGKGLQPKPNAVCGDLTQAYDRETTPILGTLSNTPQFMRVFAADARDVGKTIIVQGTDQNGNTILGTDPNTDASITGEVIVVTSPFAQSQNEFATITGIQKDPTFGVITIQQVDPVSGLAQPLTTMQPSETVANYRKYLLNSLPCSCCNSTNGLIQVTALCKVDFTPVQSDADYLVIPNVPALIAGCEGVRLECADNLKAQQMALQKHAKAMSLLFGQLDHELGKERPAISVPLFGASRLHRQPI